MKTGGCDKALKTLERVKGIEPSYSAWKGVGNRAASRPIRTKYANNSHWHSKDFPACPNASLAVVARPAFNLISAKRRWHRPDRLTSAAAGAVPRRDPFGRALL